MEGVFWILYIFVFLAIFIIFLIIRPYTSSTNIINTKKSAHSYNPNTPHTKKTNNYIMKTTPIPPPNTITNNPSQYLNHHATKYIIHKHS